MNRIELRDDELDRLMEMIRQEITEQDRGAAETPMGAEGRSAAPTSPTAPKRVKRLKDLLRLDETAFVTATFQAMLGRDPSPGEADYHLDRLRDGRLSKVGLVLELGATKEGRKRAAKIKGLRKHRIKAALAVMPVLGPLVVTIGSWMRMPRLASNVSRVRHQVERLQRSTGQIPDSVGWRLDQSVSGLREEIAKQSERLTAQVERVPDRMRAELSGRLHALATQLDELGDQAAAQSQRLARIESDVGQEIAALTQRLDEGLARTQAALDQRLVALEATAAAHAGDSDMLGSVNHRLIELAQRLAVLQRVTSMARLSPSAPSDSAVASPPRAPDAAASDAFYAAFEDCFRGSREDIVQRQSTHLPLLQAQGSGLTDLPVIDIGCGRGEWLELLGRHGIKAVGVDLNRLFLAENAERGLDVVEADALAYLRSQPDDSARAVTGFHIIEHLPFDVLQDLLAETLRVLAEGGLVLFETPNPENLITAAHKFYYDPTHHHPIPPEVASFLLHARGFREVEIRRLHASQDPAREEITPGALRDLLYGPQDYAVVGYR